MIRAIPAVQGARGFTLIELLIAVTVFAIVLAAINSVFYGAMRLRKKTADSIEEALPLQRATMVIKRDLANILPPGGQLAGALQSTSLSTSTTNLLSGQVSPSFYCANGTLDELVPWGDIQQVSYQLVQPTNRAAVGMDLVRAVRRNLLSTAAEQPFQEWLMSGVQTMTFWFYDGSRWLPTWDSSTMTNLPLAIKVDLQLASASTTRGRTIDAPVEIIVPLDAQGPMTNATEQTADTAQ